jgi:hypothetical protein
MAGERHGMCESAFKTAYTHLISTSITHGGSYLATDTKLHLCRYVQILFMNVCEESHIQFNLYCRGSLTHKIKKII